MASGHTNAEIGNDLCTTQTARQYKDPPIVVASAFSKRPQQQIANRQDDMCYAISTGEPPRGLEARTQEPFRKSRRAQTADDFETWVPAETTNTLNSFDVGDIRSTEVVVESKAFQQNTGSAGTVRRLTPIECERLQGFPDNWTQIPWKGKPANECPDGYRYKACGNSMAVPVMRWLGARIAAELRGAEHTYGIPSAFRDEVESR